MIKPKYISIATKLNMNAVARLKVIAHSQKMTIFQLLQSVASFIIQTFDTIHSATDEEAVVIRDFNNVSKQTFQVCDPDAEIEIYEGIYLLSDSSGQKKGTYGALVERPFFDRYKLTYNSRTILDHIFKALFPKTYKELMYLAEQHHCQHILEVIHLMIVSEQDRLELEELREGFNDNRRSEWGINPVDTPYKRINNMSDEQRQKVQQLDLFDEMAAPEPEVKDKG